MKKLKILLLIMLSTSLFSKEIIYQDFAIRSIVSVYDGDTFRVNLLCKEPLLCSNIPIRIFGINTPERRGGSGTDTEKRKAKIAQKYTYKFLKNSRVRLVNCFRGKYFRLVCNVKSELNEDISDYLINTGYAVPYFGGTKTKDWSDENDGL